MRKQNWIDSASGETDPQPLRPTQLRTNKRPKCATCKIVMRLTRREAHPAHGPAHELQTYTCSRCGHVEQASSASPGAV